VRDLALLLLLDRLHAGPELRWSFSASPLVSLLPLIHLMSNVLDLLEDDLGDVAAPDLLAGVGVDHRRADAALIAFTICLKS
jgi:hypothetical protein